MSEPPVSLTVRCGCGDHNTYCAATITEVLAQAQRGCWHDVNGQIRCLGCLPDEEDESWPLESWAVSAPVEPEREAGPVGMREQTA